jgi:hypothetical protein
LGEHSDELGEDR